MEIQPQISIKNRKTGERHLYRLDQERISVGRDRSNYIVLDSRTISRRHAEISREGTQYFIADLKSNNGTSLNEKNLPPHDKTLLHSGDLIQIDDYDLHFQIPAPGQVEDIYEITDTDLLEIKMVKKLLKAMDRDNAPSLEVMEGPQTGTRFALSEKNQDIVVGRDPACEFKIDSDVISRKHARIEKHFDTVVLHDLGSKNGTFVNRERIKEQRLQDGDILHLGTLALSFRNPQDLAFELEPPKLKKEPPTPVKEPSFPKEIPAEAEEAASSLPGARASRKKGQRVEVQQLASEEIEAPPPENPEEAPSQDFIEEPPAGFKLAPAEILTIVIGLLVLIGSVWGILKILK